MDGFSVLDFSVWEPTALKDHPAYPAGNALGWLYRGNKQAATNYPLVGRLYVAKSGWLLLSVPNALVRGVFDAMSVPGAELPTAGVFNVPNVEADVLNAHISVMTADEVSKIGEDKINERGHMFAYRIGSMKEIDVKSVDGVSKVWAIHVTSPALASLRKSYGLTPLPNGDHDFHITVAVRRKKVLQDNDVRKAADDQLSRSGKKDLLHGGEADNLPDREFSPHTLAQGTQHEHEHTDNDQVAKEIAKDHLSEDPDYYEKVEEIEKESRHGVLKDLKDAKEHSDHKRYDQKTQILRRLMSQSPHDWVIDDAKPHFKGVTHVPTKFRFHAEPTAIPASVKAAYTNAYTPYKSVYVQEMLNQLSRRYPISYDHNLPVFKNIQNQLAEIKGRGDFILRTQRNYDIYRSQLDPAYRHHIAMQAFRGDAPQPAFMDRFIENNGQHFLNALGGGK